MVTVLRLGVRALMLDFVPSRFIWLVVVAAFLVPALFCGKCVTFVYTCLCETDTHLRINVLVHVVITWLLSVLCVCVCVCVRVRVCVVVCERERE